MSVAWRALAWALLTGLLLAMPGPGRPAEGKRAVGKPPAAAVKGPSEAERLAQKDDRFWKQIADRDPPDNMSLRGLFRYQLSLCESRQHAERLERLCDLAARAQDRDPKSPHYGNLKWTWRDSGVTDTNAVEFVCQDAIIAWRNDRDWMPPAARDKHRAFLVLGIEGCLRHRVPVSYTNIAILNAANLIVLGETFERPEVAEEGYRRLDAIAVWTWAFGTREFDSPTYYGVDVAGLEFIHALAQDARGRRQAEALLELFWTDVSLNFFPPATKLAGAQSRSYDYLRGLGHLDRYFQSLGWIEGPGAAEASLDVVPHWTPPDRVRALRNQVPRVVRQSWGISTAESRTHAVWPDVTLSTAGASYGSQDMLLTVDLPGDRNLARCYFIPDGREDPYGKIRYETGSARHMKALHLAPFWAAAQRGADALGLAIYRQPDLAGKEVNNVQSHFVVRRGAEGIWIGGRKTELPHGTSQAPGRVALGPDQSLVLRYQTAAVGVRLVWSRAQDGQPASAALVDDGLREALRLTVEHRREHAESDAGVALWVRVGTGLGTSEALDAWRKSFDAARPRAVEVTPQRVRIEVPGESGPVSVVAGAPYDAACQVALVPPPARDPIELDGRALGRALLDTVEPMAGWRGKPSPIEPIAVPAKGGVQWEAESGLILSGMTAADDPQASGGRYVWQPEDSRIVRYPGSVLWTLRVAQPGRYYLWARVLAPDGQHDSFHVALLGEGCRLSGSAWNVPKGPSWRWQSVRLESSKSPTPLDLPAGICRLQFRVRELGTKVDRLMLSTDPRAKPE